MHALGLWVHIPIQSEPTHLFDTHYCCIWACTCHSCTNVQFISLDSTVTLFYRWGTVRRIQNRAQFKISNLVNHTNSRTTFLSHCLHVDIKMEMLWGELLQDDCKRGIPLLCYNIFVNFMWLVKWQKLLLCLGNIVQIFSLKMEA